MKEQQTIDIISVDVGATTLSLAVMARGRER